MQMSTLTLGPLVLPVGRLVLIIAVAAVFLVSRWRNAAQHKALERALWWSLGVGLVCARIAFVLGHLSSFGQEPWQALYFWEDGYVWSVGVGAAMIVAAEFARRGGYSASRLLGPLLVGLLIWAGSGWIADLPRAGPPTLLPEQALASLSGDSVSLSSFRGQPTVVNLWATWCPPCRREMPVLAAAQLAHPDVHFLFVNQGEASRTIAAYLTTQKLSIENVLLDAESSAFRDFGVQALPTTLFFDAQGRMIERYLGALSAAGLDDYLEQLLTRSQ